MSMLPPQASAYAAPLPGAGQQLSVLPAPCDGPIARTARPVSTLAGAVHAKRPGLGSLEQGTHEDARIRPALVGEDRDREVLVRQPAHRRAEAQQTTRMPKRWRPVEVEALDAK